MKYPAENWKKLGKWVGVARRGAGFGELADWVAAVGRTDRVLLGLERGETVGDGTLRGIAHALGADLATLYSILSTGSVGPPGQDAGYVASPGERVASGVTDDEVLREIRAMRADMEGLRAEVRADLGALSERVAKLEQ